MPQFEPSESKTAVAPVTVSPSGLSCEAELFLGPDEATKVVTSGLVPFTSTGASQDVRLPVVMPDTEGTYHVYVDVYVEGLLIAAYKALEDVVIAVPAPPVALCPCVYCGATFGTEAELIAHMESKHPGRPYLVYAYPAVSQIASGAWLKINYKVYTPAVPGTENEVYFFTVYIPGFRVWEPYNGTQMYFQGGTPAGFYEGMSGMYIQYMVDRWKFVNIPRGTYHLFSMCRYCTAGPGGWTANVVQTFWQGVDTGQTITVV